MPGREKNETGELEHPSIGGTRFGAALCKIGVCSGASEEWEGHSSASRSWVAAGPVFAEG